MSCFVMSRRRASRSTVIWSAKPSDSASAIPARWLRELAPFSTALKSVNAAVNNCPIALNMMMLLRRNGPIFCSTISTHDWMSCTSSPAPLRRPIAIAASMRASSWLTPSIFRARCMRSRRGLGSYLICIGWGFRALSIWISYRTSRVLYCRTLERRLREGTGPEVSGSFVHTRHGKPVIESI